MLRANMLCQASSVTMRSAGVIFIRTRIKILDEQIRPCRKPNMRHTGLRICPAQTDVILSPPHMTSLETSHHELIGGRRAGVLAGIDHKGSAADVTPSPRKTASSYKASVGNSNRPAANCQCRDSTSVIRLTNLGNRLGGSFDIQKDYSFFILQSFIYVPFQPEHLILGTETSS